MLIAGIIGREGKVQTANLINSILSARGKKVSVIDSANLAGLDDTRVKNYLRELEKNNVDILVLKVNITDIKKEIYDILHFDIMIYTDKADDLIEEEEAGYKELMRRTFSLLDEKGLIIVNVDDRNIGQVLEGLKHHIVTYGFNSKASITTSSVGDTVSEGGLMCCLQRTISAKNGLLVEPQEYKVNVESSEFDTHNVLAAATFAIVNGVDLN